MQLPEKYGNWRCLYNRLRMWAADGAWERVFTALLAQADTDEELNWVISVDSTIVLAHQHAAGARKKGPRPASRTTTKIHLAADGNYRPLVFHLIAGQAGDAPTFAAVMARLRVPRRRGRHRTWPEALLADKAYVSRAIRETSGGAVSGRSSPCRPINADTARLRPIV